jgi:apolipoprotein N-acyltransferase
VLVKSALNSEDALLSSIRQNDKITFYTRYGDFLGRIAAGITGMILLYYIGGRFRRKRFLVGT